MEKLIKKREQLLQALATLYESLDFFQKISDKKITPCPPMDYDQTYRIYRDSVIQRFEYCADLFWKYIKKYTEAISGPIEYNAPTPVIRKGHSVGILSEAETETALEMIKDRNLTSHIYKEEIAEYLTVNIPKYYQLMHQTAERLAPKRKPN